MFDEIRLRSEFFELLTGIDATIAARVVEKGCRFCGGPLHRGDYPRKPRGGLVAEAAEAFARRFSLCCGREGCRRRATPPSVRFLGRRVYVAASAARRVTGIPERTTRRWLRWWRGEFVQTPVFVALSGRLVPGIDRVQLPRSILERFAGPASGRLQELLTWLAPITTTSTPDGSRFVRGTV